jgi:excisionase family DNA binding protein
MPRPNTCPIDDHDPVSVPQTPPITPPIDDREFISVREAARISGVGRTKLYALMADGRLKFIKIDKRRLVVRRSISALANECPPAIKQEVGHSTACYNDCRADAPSARTIGLSSC